MILFLGVCMLKCCGCCIIQPRAGDAIVPEERSRKDFQVKALLAVSWLLDVCGVLALAAGLVSGVLPVAMAVGYCVSSVIVLAAPAYPPVLLRAVRRAQLIVEVAKDGRALEYASAELQADQGVVLAAVTQDGRALQYVSAELRADREVALAAVTQDGFALEYASAELQ